MKTGRRVPEPLLSIVDLEQSGGMSSGVQHALALLPLKQIVQPADTVVIKPNLVCAAAVETCGTTSPETLRAVIGAIKQLGPRRLVVAEGPGLESATEMLAITGMDVVLEEEGVEFVDLNAEPVRAYAIEHDRPPMVTMNRFVEEIDVLISLCVLKMHEEATMTAALKNIALSFPAGVAYDLPKAEVSGLPHPARQDLHADLHGFIVAMGKRLPIDLAIIEANDVMIGTGPIQGKPAHAGMLLAGTDAVALDVLAAHLFGFKPQAVRYLWQALQDHLGEGVLDRMEIRGMAFERAARLFTQRVFGKEIVVR